MVIDKKLDALGDAAEEFFAVEDGGQFAADLLEEHERFGLLGVGSKEALRDGIDFTRGNEGAEFGWIVHSLEHSEKPSGVRKNTRKANIDKSYS